MDIPLSSHFRGLMLDVLMARLFQNLYFGSVLSGIVGGLFSYGFASILSFWYTPMMPIFLCLLPGSILGISFLLKGSMRYILISMAMGSGLWLSPISIILFGGIGFFAYLRYRHDLRAILIALLKKYTNKEADLYGDLLIVEYSYMGQTYKTALKLDGAKPRGSIKILVKYSDSGDFTEPHNDSEIVEILKYLGPDRKWAGNMPTHLPYTVVRITCQNKIIDYEM